MRGLVSSNNNGGINIGNPPDQTAYWEKVPTDYNFRIRLAPDYLGYWNYDVKIWLGTTLLGEYNNGFVVSPQNEFEKGFVTLDANRKYLKYKEPDAGSLFLIGENVDVFKEWLHPQSHQLQKEVIQGVIDGGGNFVELMMVPENFGIEREVMGNYASKATHLSYYSHNVNINSSNDNLKITRQMNAWEFDQMLNFIEDEKIYCQIALDMPGMYLTTGDQKCNGEIQQNFDWSYWSMNWNPVDYFADIVNDQGNVVNHHFLNSNCNPYNIQSETNWNRTLAFNQLLFFADTEAQRYYKRKLRYISSRWGYSPHIISYEIHGEIDQEAINICWEDNAADRNVIRNWVDMASSYLKEYLQDPHLLTFSSVFPDDVEASHFEDQPFDLPNIDLINYSMYNLGSLRDGNINKASQYNSHKTAFPGKAEFIGEYGGLDVINCDQFGYHNDLWATAFMGNIGTANHWDWNKHFYYGRFDELSALKHFMEGVDFEWNNFSPHQSTISVIQGQNGEFNFDTQNRIEYFYLQNRLQNQTSTQAMGWVHNRSAYWANNEYWRLDPLTNQWYFYGNDCIFYTDNNNDGIYDDPNYCPNDDPDCIDIQNNLYNTGVLKL